MQSEYKLTEIESLKKFRSDCEESDYVVSLEFKPTLAGTPNSWVDDGKQWHCAKTSLDPDGRELPFVHACLEENKGTVIALERLRDSFGVSSVFRHLPLYHVLLKYNAFILHASYILINGQAILFSAPSETGKSTQAELWKNHRNARIVNGDRVVVRKTDKGWTAGGIHYSGTSEYCENITAPVRAIVLLGQAKENSVQKCAGAEAFRRLFHECAYSSEYENDPAEIAELLVGLVNEVDVVKLDCLPDESAVEALENYLSGENN